MYCSALAQDLSPEEYEILVIDDGSTDGSLAAAEKAAQGTPTYMYTKPNEGLSRTRNYGTDRAAGRYVMYLDADDYLEPNVSGTWWKPWSAEGSTCCASK